MRKPKSELFRITCEKSGRVAFDPKQNAEGRGAYLCKETKCVTLAAKKNGLSRAFHRNVPADIYEVLFQEIERIAKQA